MSTTDPIWLAEARKHIGTREIPGIRHEPRIVQWWKDIKRGGIKDDETPWCAAFVGAMLERTGLMSSRFESARSYLQWGVPLPGPATGAIAVFSRDGGGHVGFVVGQTPDGKSLLILGGNQGNEVNIRAISVSRLSGIRWPAPVPLPPLTRVLAGWAPASTTEA